MNLQLYNKASMFAAKWHKDQKYKIDSAEPFISHPFNVAAILERHGLPEHVVIAGLLHDVVEDTACTIEEVRANFPADVAALVEEATVDQTIPWEERQKLTQAHLRTASPDYKALKCADYIHHLVLFIGFVDAGYSKIFRHGTVAEYTLKYEKGIAAIAEGWSHPIILEAQKKLAAFIQQAPKIEE